MANAIGSNIEAVDYNTIRNKIDRILGPGLGQYGYGQTLVSSDVAPGQDITANDWKALRWDIFNTRVHQDGFVPTIAEPLSGEPIRFGGSQPNNQYDAQSELATVNRFNIGAGQFVIDSGSTQTRTTGWNTSVTASVTVTFNNANQARWFFNSGGEIRFSSSRTGGSVSRQNETWSTTLERIGTIPFGANSPILSFYNLTDVNQTFYSTNVSSIYQSSSPYSSNNFVVRALCDTADNSQGGATTIIFTVTWQDSYVDSSPSPPPDLVDGTLTLNVTELRASGILQNGTSSPGSFTIARPSYSISTISGS